MGEGTVFSLSVHTSTGGGGTPFQVQMGVPHPRSRWGGGTPFQVQVGVPDPRSRWGGGTPTQVQAGRYPIPGPGGGGYPILLTRGGPWGTPIKTGWGTPLSRIGWGTLSLQDWMGYPPPPIRRSA